MFHLQKPLKIYNSLLRELVSKWSSKSKSLKIREHLVPFNVFMFMLDWGWMLVENKLVRITVNLGWLIICLVRRTLQLTRLF